MYGYCTPRKPELSKLRVMPCEGEVSAYLRSYPVLTRDEVLSAMARVGPLRSRVESELARMARDRRR